MKHDSKLECLTAVLRDILTEKGMPEDLIDNVMPSARGLIQAHLAISDLTPVNFIKAIRDLGIVQGAYSLVMPPLQFASEGHHSDEWVKSHGVISFIVGHHEFDNTRNYVGLSLAKLFSDLVIANR